jgi:hypothetical protein
MAWNLNPAYSGIKGYGEPRLLWSVQFGYNATPGRRWLTPATVFAHHSPVPAMAASASASTRDRIAQLNTTNV